MADRTAALYMQGRYLIETVHVRLCGVCSRGEYWTYHDRKFVRVTYHDGSPVMHRR